MEPEPSKLCRSRSWLRVFGLPWNRSAQKRGGSTMPIIMIFLHIRTYCKLKLLFPFCPDCLRVCRFCRQWAGPRGTSPPGALSCRSASPAHWPGRCSFSRSETWPILNILKTAMHKSVYVLYIHRKQHFYVQKKKKKKSIVANVKVILSRRP